jgi:hypothetical protein
MRTTETSTKNGSIYRQASLLALRIACSLTTVKLRSINIECDLRSPLSGAEGWCRLDYAVNLVEVTRVGTAYFGEVLRISRPDLLPSSGRFDLGNCMSEFRHHSQLVACLRASDSRPTRAE